MKQFGLGLAIGLLLALMLAFTYPGDGSNGWTDGESWTAAAANSLETALDTLETSVAALQAIDTIAEQETAESVNIILATEIDSKTELNNLIAGDDAVFGTDIGSTVQAFDTDLTDLADGSLSGSKIGSGLDAAVITTGTIASTARLPSAVIETSEIDTTVELNAIILDADFLTATGTYDLAVTGSAVFSGPVEGGTKVYTISGSSQSLAASAFRNSMHICTNAAGCDITLPAAAADMAACFRDGNGGGLVILDAAAGDEIELDGVGVGVADAIDSAGNKGDFICLLAIDATTWVTMGRSGTWVDGGAD